ncbi:Partitioning defective 3 homolog [Eumeta japonica]|uniref:Partitioning defective 3 homolog n=1 Tax=Eumeta variegata TaxID=151549 RepID=A0A4C1ZRC0_EUMVA|nr:Partitioning defective 3 homolog [Eumeta japonica]
MQPSSAAIAAPVPPPRTKKLARLAAAKVRQGPETWVSVRALRASSGGILDPDDRVCDVADDRETLTAECAARPPSRAPPADGASGSSAGTASPDMFREEGPPPCLASQMVAFDYVKNFLALIYIASGGARRRRPPTASRLKGPRKQKICLQVIKKRPRKPDVADVHEWCSAATGGSMRVPASESCVEVGTLELEDGASGLQVRRGSEPSLHQDTLPPQRPRIENSQVSEQTKRWSAAIVCRDDTRITQKVHPIPDSQSLESDSERHPPYVQHHHMQQHFQRHSNRLSMQFSGPGNGVWLDVAEKIQSYGSKSLPRDARKEPLGQDTNVNSHQNHRVEDMLRWVSGVNNVASVHSVQERPLDLLPTGSAERAVIGVEVPVSPSTKPTGCSKTVSVTLVKGEKGLDYYYHKGQPDWWSLPHIHQKYITKAVTDGRLRAGDRLVSVNGVSVLGLTQQQVVTLLRNTPTDSAVEIVIERTVPNRTQRVEPQESPKKIVEKQIGLTNSEQQETKPIENGRVSSIVNAINQNNSNGNSSSVNNSMRGRISKSSSKDNLINKDQTPDKNNVKDVLNSSINSITSLRNRLILQLDVPVHDSEKAGLGISVKGKVTVGPDPQDLGIFIKSVLHGGAASRDGRLHTNDQLLSVNGVSLVGQSNAEAMETLRRALLHSRPQIQGNISLTIARRTESMDSLSRWKDDTPPSTNDSSKDSNENSSSQNFTSNTVIYNSNSGHDKENNSNTQDVNSNQQKTCDSNQKDRNYENFEGKSNKKHSSIVTINNNNSWVLNQSDDSKGYLERDKDSLSVPRDNKRDSFEWSRLDGWNPVIDRLTGLRNESYYIATQSEGPVANGQREYRSNMGHVHLQRSPPSHPNVIIEEDYVTSRIVKEIDNCSGSTSGAPWESGSECGEGAFSRDAVGRRSMSEKRHAAVDAKTTGTYKKIKEMKAINAMQVGPSLGMRKSSSLESLQTVIQENQRNPNHEPLYARAGPPLKHWLTDDHHAPETMVRGSPQQSSLSHKKPSLLKSLSTMFRLGKPHKKPDQEACGRSQPGRSSEKSLSREASERHVRNEERLEEQRQANNQQRLVPQHSRQSSGERSGEKLAPPYRPPPARTAPAHHAPQSMDNAWGPAGHYVNYEEIQHNLNVRREKLSEVQIGQMRRQVSAQRAKVEEESRRAGGSVGAGTQARWCREGARPQSNYYEYESAPPRRPGKLSHYH